MRRLIDCTFLGSSVAMGIMLVVCLPQAAGHAGDLGRPQRSFLFSWPVATWISDPLVLSGLSSLALTVDEVAMRDAAYRLRVHIHNLAPIGMDPFSATSYASNLRRADFHYGPSRMARIDNEIQADHEALVRFGYAARRVLVADRERSRALHELGPAYSNADRHRATTRMKENQAFIEGTFGSLALRLAAYRRAIDTTRIETPAVASDMVDANLVHLSDRITSLRYELASFQSGVLLVGQGSYDGAAPPLPSNEPMDIRPGSGWAPGYPMK